MKEIYLAGGCFWGVEEYFRRIEGISYTEVGYANGIIENPTYEEVCRQNTGYSETVYLKYEEDKISLRDVLKRYFKIIDPTLLDRQGPDIGNQYRTGIYYVDKSDLPVIEKEIEILQTKYKEKICINS